MLQGSQLEIICSGIWNMLRLTFPEPYLDTFHVLICDWEKVYGTNHADFPKFLFDFFLFKSPSKQHDHIPAEYFPIEGKKKSKYYTEYSDRLRKKPKKTQMFYLDLIQANTHWFQGDLNCFRTKLKTRWKSVRSFISSNCSHFLYSTSRAKGLLSVQYITIPFFSSEEKSQSNHSLWSISILLCHCYLYLNMFLFVLADNN